MEESGQEQISTSHCLLLDYPTHLGTQHILPGSKYLLGTLQRDEGFWVWPRDLGQSWEAVVHSVLSGTDPKGTHSRGT